jgi:FkbM family methyltransferase
MASFARLLGAGLAQAGRGVTRLFGRRTGARAAAHASGLLAPVVEVQTSRGPLRFRCASARSAALATGFLKHEPDTQSWIDDHVKPDDVLWDIGANIGAYTLYAGLTRAVRVVAFEPLASTYAMMADNIALNGIGDRAMALCAALSNASGFVPLYLASIEPGTAMHALGTPKNVAGEFDPAVCKWSCQCAEMRSRGDRASRHPPI